MSNHSLESKIQSLEEKLKAENESIAPRDVRPIRHPTPKTFLGSMSGSQRPNLNLTVLKPVICSERSETDIKLQEIKMSGMLTINNARYKSDIRDLEHLGELGDGTCGHVVKMRHKPSKAVIAVKQMRRSGNSEENKRILMDLEVVMRSDNCPYIVRCLGCFVTESDVWICMELMASCFDKILKRLSGPVPEDILGKVTVATVKALSYLKEEHGVIHRDVKPSNILVDERGTIKLCDFGISGRLVDSKAKTRSAGCAAYMAPERIDPPDPTKPDYDIRADVWSLGISLVELATGIFPYRDCQNDFEVLTKVINEEPPALPDSQTFSPEFKSFVQQCLTKNYRDRPKYAALLHHPFLQRAAASQVRVDSWLAQVLLPQRVDTPPIIRRKHIAGNIEDMTTIIPHPHLPLLNGTPSPGAASRSLAASISNGQLDISTFEAEHTPKPRKRITPPPLKLPSPLQETAKNIINNKPEANTIACDLSDRVQSPEEEESSCSINVDSEAKNVSLPFVESLPPSAKYIEDGDKRIKNPPLEKTTLRLERGNASLEYTTCNPNVCNVNIPNRCQNFSYAPIQGTSPKEYYLQQPQRVRSFSNTMVYGPSAAEQRHPPSRFVSGSPNTKNYFANLEIRNQPFSGGGEPSSFDSYTNPGGPGSGEYNSGFYPYGSPDVARRQFFSPSRGKVTVHHQPCCTEYPRETHHNVVSPPNFVLGREGYDNVVESRFSPPCFRPNGPTSYFTSTSVCTMSRFAPASLAAGGVVPSAGGYHHNPGGSCSQPASLEAYGDTRHYAPYGHSRVSEKAPSPALWSPQAAARRAAHDRDERWRTEQPHQVQGNTSPIVLQRFYHQQGQRRSRRDLRDPSPRQRTVSREASVGRSPEPPRRAHRDPSSGRTDPPPHPMDHPLLRERREKDRTPSEHRLPEREGTSSMMDRDRQPDLIKPHHKYERDPRYSQDSRESDSSLPSTDRDRESIINSAKERFELRSQHKENYHHHHHHHKRDRERKDDLNGDSYKSDKDDTSERDSLHTARERFEIRMKERRSSKDGYNHSRERERKEETNGEAHRSERDESNRLSPLAVHRHGKSHGKDKDEQGGSRGGVPTGPHGGAASSPVTRSSRFGGLPRRVADAEFDSGDVGKRLQDCSNNFVPGFRYGGAAPQPPPRRAAESWSLPGSPLPARPM